MAAERLLDVLWIETLKDVADGGVGGRALPVQAERGVQPAAVHSDEGLDRTKGIAAGDDGKNGEQQNIGQLVEHTFRPAGVRDLAEHGEEWIERLHGNLLRFGCPT